MAGGLTGTAAAAAGVSVLAHLAAVSTVGLAMALASSVWLVTEREHGGQPVFARPSRRLPLLGLLAFCAFGLDGAAYNWSAVDLRTEHDAPPALAAASFTGFALALAVGRLFGDRLVARFGRVRVMQASAVVTADGGGLVVSAPTGQLGLAGWALFGLGLASVAPTLLGAAARTGDTPPAVAIATVTTIGYLGSFTGPPPDRRNRPGHQPVDRTHRTRRRQRDLGRTRQARPGPARRSPPLATDFNRRLVSRTATGTILAPSRTSLPSHGRCSVRPAR